MNIGMQYEITTALGLEVMYVDLRAAKKRIHELNGKLIVKNDQIMNLTRENKSLHHSLEGMREKCRFLKEAVLVREKQLSLKKKIAKEWMETGESKQFVARLGANTVSQGMRVKELMFEYAHEKLGATPDWETFFSATDAEYDRAIHQATEKLKEIEEVGPDEEDAADREAWEKVLAGEVEARFRDVDFAHYDISIPSRPATPSSSPIAAVPLLPPSSDSPASPAASGGEGLALDEEQLEPLFSMEELFSE
ncbi:uncharacterized protein LOC130805297 [Amaranthus tricolor]|uniref:uncharacterized protein LOC130805297 n=1 Tax=Amaranthus tricolor TaxID=29722 RepID=UPI00258440C0|nr:uncharacterized protein LOC130805297 [Amaranthus tricolor]